MSKTKGTIVINTERCKGCRLCLKACHLNLISMTDKIVNHKGYSYAQQVNWEDCNGCSACAIVCPDGCITVYRKKEE